MCIKIKNVLKKVIFALTMSFFCAYSLSAQINVTGTVIDVAGAVVPGVNVVVKGTATGTVTDGNGRYSITILGRAAALVFSFMGYTSQTIAVGNRTEISITLEEDSQELEEVVVVGYGTVKKRDLTGSVASVNAAKLQQVPVTTTAQALQGRIAGVLVTTTNWAPGESAGVLIRGKRSMKASNDPLYVVDGIPMTAGMNEISPTDIESIDILKDASATAIYGARGANGVILITTKKGKDGVTQIEYNGYYGFQTVLNDLEYMSGAEYAECVREAYRATGVYTSPTPDKVLDYKVPSFGGRANGDLVNFSDPSVPYTWESIARAYDASGNYDPSMVRADSEWWNDVKRMGMLTDHQLSIRGGNEMTRFLISGTYNKNSGVYKGQDYQRYSIRFNLDHQIGKYIKIGGQTQFSHSLNNRGVNMQENWRSMPIGRYYDDAGNLLRVVSGTDNQWWNPLQNLVEGAVVRPRRTNRYLGSYYGEIQLPLDGLRFRTNVGLDYLTIQDDEFYGSSTYNRQGKVNYARNATENRLMYTWENLLYYDKTFGKHTVGATLLQSIQRDVMDSNNIPGEGLPSDDLLYYDMASAATPGKQESNHSQWSLASYMARVNYGYDNRYLLTVSARYDGASRLAEGHKWVMFPAAALAWRISEESFFDDVTVINNLKLRAGIGTTANSAISPYQTKGQLKTMYYNYGTTTLLGYAPDLMPNSTLTWETTQQWNIGIDFGLFKSRINVSVDLYLSNTHDLLLDRQLPVVSGFDRILSNVGRTRNRGIEISLTSVNISRKDFTWTTDWMFYANREEIVELYSGRKDDVGNKWFIGKPINVFFDYQKVGIWQDTEADRAEMANFNNNGGNFKAGTIKLYDNGDYKITSDDRVIQGQERPKFTASLMNTFSYRDFDFSFFFYGSCGSMIENNLSYLQQSYRNNNVKINYWTPFNPSNDAPRPDASKDPDYVSTMYYEKADFLRLRTLTFGYTLPKRLSERVAISRCRVYVTAQNPWIWTNYTGIDPEGARGYAAPSVSSWLVGLNLAF